MSVSSDNLAREILDTVPVIMRTVRAEMRSRRTAKLTIPQFRSLLFLNRNPGSSLLDLASHLGLTSPTVCKMVDGLVADQLVTRQDSSQDRRKVLLTLTPAGQVILEQAHSGTRDRLADILSVLDAEEREVIFLGMKRLQALFSPEAVPVAGSGR
jgi:DNA-binding MarR family transcriptional regulator